MIITITGKPCSGKGTVSKLICSEHNFEYVCTGDMFRSLAKKNGYDSILEFQQNEDVTKIDYEIDNQIAELGRKKANEDILIDSRLAWHFVPKSFKVFIDIDWKTAGERLLNSKRETEQANNLRHAIHTLKNRWKIENKRYKKIYKIDNLNSKNYDFIISSKDLTPNQVADAIMEAYIDFVQNA